MPSFIRVVLKVFHQQKSKRESMAHSHKPQIYLLTPQQGRFASYGTPKVKRLLATVVCVTLLIALAANIAAVVARSNQQVELFNVTASFINEVQSVQDILHELEATVPQHAALSSEAASEQIKLRPNNVRVTSNHLRSFQSDVSTIDKLLGQDRPQPSAAMNPFAMSPQMPSLDYQLAALRGRLTEIHVAHSRAMGRHLDQQSIWHGELLAWSTAWAVALTAVMGFFWWAASRNSPTNHRPMAATPTASDAVLEMADKEEAIRTDERARIARDLHDDVGAHLMGLKIALKCSSVTSSPMQRRSLDSEWSSMLAQVDAAMTTVARVSEALRPGTVVQAGLQEAIESYTRRFEKVTGIPCVLAIDACPFPPHGVVADEIFHIFQESLTNIARHADASRVDIKLLADHRFVMSITDNGKGISTAAILSLHSVGLTGMDERARRIGGDLHVAREPGGGTSIKVFVPLGGSK